MRVRVLVMAPLAVALVVGGNAKFSEPSESEVCVEVGAAAVSALNTVTEGVEWGFTPTIGHKLGGPLKQAQDVLKDAPKGAVTDAGRRVIQDTAELREYLLATEPGVIEAATSGSSFVPWMEEHVQPVQEHVRALREECAAVADPLG
jgi:hypothetical protein